eukprot:jgi/Bigna1/125455/aug1.1_g163
MKVSASQPALDRLSIRFNKRGHRDTKGKMRVVRSENDIKQIRNPMKNIMMRVPMYAIHGMNMRAISRIESRGSMGSGISQQDFSETVTTEADMLIEKTIKRQHCTPVLSVVVISVLMGAINFGYNTSVLNTPEFVIRTSLDSEGGYVDDFSWAIIVSIFCMGGLIGSTLAPPILDTVGRKTFMFFNGVFLTVCLIFQACSMSVMWLVMARLMIGVSCGGNTVAVPLYLGEIAPVNLRGMLGTLNQFAMVVGILLAQVLGKPLGSDPEWRYLLAIGAIFSSAQVCLSVCVPESPRWLVMNNRIPEAEKTLELLRGTDEDAKKYIEIEVESMLELAEEEKQEMSVTSLVRKPVDPALSFHGWRGSPGFFASAKFADPYLGTVLCGFVNVLATGFAVELMDRAGRKALLTLSALGMTLSSILLTFSLVASNEFAVELGYIEVMGVLSYVAFFEFGLGPIPWAITAELFGAVERATAMGACSAVNWIANFIVGLTFPAMNGALGSYTFLPFALVTFFAMLFSIWYVPETKGKTLAEIRESMQAKKDDTVTKDKEPLMKEMSSDLKSMEDGVY